MSGTHAPSGLPLSRVQDLLVQLHPVLGCALEGWAAVRQVRDEINKFKVGAPARVGLVAPNDVVVPLGNTGLDPSQTSFFQARA